MQESFQDTVRVDSEKLEVKNKNFTFTLLEKWKWIENAWSKPKIPQHWIFAGGGLPGPMG